VLVAGFMNGGDYNCLPGSDKGKLF